MFKLPKKHTEETSHSEFISLDKMDNYCSKHGEIYKYFDNNAKKHLCEICLKRDINNNKYIKDNLLEISKFIKFKESIDKNSFKAKENIKMYNNIAKVINEWLEKITNKFNTFLNSIRNYCILQNKIVSSLNFEKSYEKYMHNFNAYSNYDNLNNEKIDRLIKNINNSINNNYYQKDDLSKFSLNMINILDILEHKNINIEAKKTISYKEKNLIPLYSKKIEDEQNPIKVELMERKKYEIK